MDPAAVPATRALPGHSSGGVRTRPAIGAAVRALLPDGRRLVGFADGGNGHSGKRSPDVHLGLGRLAPDAVVTVEIRWRDGAGRLREETLRPAPGWHTVLLARQDRAP